MHIGYEDGKRIRKHVMGRTRNEVKDKLALLMRAHEEKRPIPDQRAKLGPYLRRWLDEGRQGHPATVDVPQLRLHELITLTSNTYGHVLEQRQRQVAQAMDAVLGGAQMIRGSIRSVMMLNTVGGANGSSVSVHSVVFSGPATQWWPESSASEHTSGLMTSTPRVYEMQTSMIRLPL